MTVYERVIRGAEAGALSGAGVALIFLAGDLLSLAPLHTPVVLANGVFGAPADPSDTGILVSAAAMAGMGFRLLAYTVLHFAAFALVGIVAAFVLKTGTFGRSLLGGAAFGATVLTTVFYGSRWVIHEAPVLVETAGVGGIVGANMVAGLILGAGLHLADRDEGSGQAEAGA